MTHPSDLSSLAGPNRARSGFAVLELLTVLALLAIGLRLVPPLVQTRVDRARGVEIVQRVEAVAAATRAWAEGAEASPGEAAAVLGEPGERPEVLAPYLGDAGPWRSDSHTLAWSSWRLGPQADAVLAGSRVAVIQVRIPDPRVRDAVRRLAHPSIWLDHGDTLAFLVAGL